MDLLKNLDNMITAEEFLKTDNAFSDEDIYLLKQDLKMNNILDINDISTTMIEFAKMHVEAALKEAYNNSEMRVSENDTNEYPSFTNNYDDGYVTITVSKNSILYAYPLENIK